MAYEKSHNCSGINLRKGFVCFNNRRNGLVLFKFLYSGYRNVIHMVVGSLSNFGQPNKNLFCYKKTVKNFIIIAWHLSGPKWEINAEIFHAMSPHHNVVSLTRM